MKRKVRRLLDIHYKVTDLEKDMTELLKDNYTIQTISGCGVVLASTIIGEIRDINRFTSPGALSKYAGCSPRKISEGKSKSQALVCLRRQMVNIVWMMMKHKTVYRNA